LDGGILVFGNDKKTIGVFISEVNNEFQDTISKGIITKAKELDYNLAFYTNFGGYGQKAYDKGESYITDLPNYEELDGIIIAPDTMVVPNLEERYKENIKNRSHCPVVSVRREIKDYYNVLVDDYTVLDEIIRHFIEVHNFTRINFLAGPKGSPDADKRLAAYKKILSEHDIPVESDRIYYGDFWRHAGILAVDHWLSSSLERPQVIICANDHMALTVCRALREKGILIPEQIAVTGCDDIEDAAEFSPSLTTVKMPIFNMGMEAVDKIYKHNLGIEQPKNTFLNTVTIYRASCGCKKNWYHEGNDRRRNHISDRETLQRAITRNAYMSTDLTGLTKLDEINEKIWTYIYENENFSHFCICLGKDWDQYLEENREKSADISNEMMMEVGFKNRIGYSKLKCPEKEMIPAELMENRAMTYFFALLHHREHYFGYVGISFETIRTYMHTFQAWLINLSNALENVRIHGEMNRLIYRLEDMSIHDDLTGLYNRRVLESLGKKYLKHCIDENSMLMLFTADMDKLKYINDKYGHAKGDIALKVVADALLKAAEDGEICVRHGGDEFMAIGMDYNEIKLAKFINRFIEELNTFNFIQDVDFGVYVSYGSKLILPVADTTIEESLNAADSRMYRQKYEKEAKRIKANIVF
jgi:diguanylate cyclase (GGDEF)-like protein